MTRSASSIGVLEVTSFSVFGSILSAPGQNVLVFLCSIDKTWKAGSLFPKKADFTEFLSCKQIVSPPRATQITPKSRKKTVIPLLGSWFAHDWIG
jgi:hypothetical protein